MKQNPATFSLASALAVCLSVATPLPSQVTKVSHARDAAIYSLVLDSLFPQIPNDKQRLLVVRDSTSVFRREDLVPEFWNDLYRIQGSDTTLVAAFEKAARESVPLYLPPDTMVSKVGWRIQYVTTEVLRAIPRTTSPAGGPPISTADGFWENFYKKFPGSVGTLQLSPIGYSPDGNRAIVLTDHGCGGLCGEGQIVTLRRDGDRWRVVAIVMTWVS